MKIKPLGNKVVIQLEEIKTETKSGIVLVETTKDELNKKRRPEGRVFAIGPYVDQVKIGDYVFVEGGIMAQNFKDDGIDYLIVTENNIMAIKNEN